MFDHLTVKQKQIAYAVTMLSISMALYVYFPFYLGSWIPATAAILCVPLDNSIATHITYVKYKGVLLGLVLTLVIWSAMNIEYRFLFLLGPLFLATRNYFQVNNPFMFVILSTVDMTFIIGYTGDEVSNFFEFVSGRFGGAVIAIMLCLLGHRCFFNKKDQVQSIKEKLIIIEQIMNEIGQIIHTKSRLSDHEKPLKLVRTIRLLSNDPCIKTLNFEQQKAVEKITFKLNQFQYYILKMSILRKQQDEAVQQFYKEMDTLAASISDDIQQF